MKPVSVNETLFIEMKSLSFEKGDQTFAHADAGKHIEMRVQPVEECEHTETICEKCIESWSWDHYIFDANHEPIENR